MTKPARRENQLDVHETFGYQFLRSILPFACIACAVASVFVFFFLGEMRIALSIYLVFLTCLYSAIRYWWFPKIRTIRAADWAGFVVLVTAAVGNWMGATTANFDSVVSCATKITIGSFVLVQSWVYAIYVAVAIAGQVGGRLASGLELDYRYQSLMILGPTYAIMARFGISRLQANVVKARTELRTKIHELQQEKRRRRDTEKQLVQAQKMEGLGLLAAGVAHDFNNHLQAIQSLSSLIELGEGEDDYPQLIQAAANDAAEICRQMLTYAGRTQDERTVLDVTDAIDDVQTMLKPGIPSFISLDFRIAEHNLFVRANKTALKQCLTNLVRNSIEAIGTNPGQIQVSVRRIDADTLESEDWSVFGDMLKSGDIDASWFGHLPAIAIEVRDDGCGMDAETLESAFDPYFTTKATGHGFGLATTLGIVRSMDGVIRCRSQVGSGTEIQIVLKETDEDSETRTHHPVPAQLENVKRILVVDDEVRVRRSMAKLLQKNDFDVVSVASASETIDAVRASSTPFDVLLVDYSMPSMNGLELLDLLRKENIQTPVVLYSGYTEESLEAREGVKPDVFLTKPVQLKDLTEAFETISALQ